MTCVMCGKEFTPKSPRQKFCSPNCRERSMRQRMKSPGCTRSKLRKTPAVRIEEIVQSSPNAYREYQVIEQLKQSQPGKFKNLQLPVIQEIPRKDASRCFNRCEGCIYFRAMPQYGDERSCHYLLDTGKPRGISPELCYRQKGTPYRREGL